MTMTWLTRDEAAAYLRVHVNTIDRWADEKRFTRYKVPSAGRRSAVRFKRDELDAVLQAQPQSA